MLKSLAEESEDTSSEVKDQELALTHAVDAMAASMDREVDVESKKEKHREYENECREKFSTAETDDISQPDEVEHKGLEDILEKQRVPSNVVQRPTPVVSGSKCEETPFNDVSILDYQRKVATLYEVLSACLAVLTPEANENSLRRRQGYDARYRVALRLLATWLDVEWIKMVCVSIRYD